jgi:signal transduction histidine kinase
MDPASIPGRWEEATKAVLQGGQPWVEGSEGRIGQAHQGVNAIVVPVRAAGELMGALGLGSDDSSLSVDDLNLLDAVAHQLAVALDNSRHYQEAKKALEELAGAQENLRTYLRLATKAQEEERKRLARELHDDTIQSLVIIRATLDTLTVGQRPSGPATARLDAVKQIIDASVDEIRRFSRDLRPSILDDLGLAQAVDWLIDDMARRTDIQTHLNVEGEPRRFSVDAELAVYRIAQEALRNVERHSGAADVHVALTFSPEGLVAQVADDGSGFDLGGVLGGQGNDVPLGLIGMQERAKLVGGTLAIEARPGEGTKVTITIGPVGLLGSEAGI